MNLGLNKNYQNKKYISVPTMSKLSFNYRVIFATSILLLLFIITTIFSRKKAILMIADGVDECFLQKLEGPIGTDDPNLINYVRQRVLRPPSEKEYNLELYKSTTSSLLYNRYRSTEISWMYLQDKLQRLFPKGSAVQSGFFIEAGAVDGEFNSNTLYLELELGWTGLLVEPDSGMVLDMLSKNRKTWVCQCCLSSQNYPYKTILSKIISKKGHPAVKRRVFNSLIESRDVDKRRFFGYVQYEDVECFPLQSLLAALNRTHVDLISLDVEDLEEEVLQVFPFDQITVDVWIIEHRNPSTQFNYVDKLDLNFIQFFEKRGYSLYLASDHSPIDYIFLRKNSTIYRSNMVSTRHVM